MAPTRILIVTLGLLLMGGNVSAYEVADVANGGTIKGTITASGKAASGEAVAVTKDNSFCGDTVPNETLLVSAGGGLANAVVMLEGITSGKALASDADYVITNKKCQFVPHVTVAPKGAMMKVRNDDPLLHNSHFYLVQADRKKNVINLALPRQGIEIGKKKILRKPGLLSLQCDAHNFMQGWVQVVEHPYAVVTSADGGFSLDGVPPGSYELRVWHETLGEKTVSVTVAAGKTAKADVAY